MVNRSLRQPLECRQGLEPLRPELVCELSYNHLQDDRFRHGKYFQRWRPARDAKSCAYAQLDTPVPTEPFRVFDALK
jgi:ATP-dependent DNA ligase